MAARRRRAKHRLPPEIRVGRNQRVGPSSPGGSTSLEIVFKNDPTVLDGRFANNGWLQELPKPLTKLWDNAVLLSPATAQRLSLGVEPSIQGGEHGQIISKVVELRYRGRTVRGPVFPVAGHPDGSATVHLGHGRTRAGHLGTGAGFNANAIRTSDGMCSPADFEVVDTGTTFSLACTQYHHLMEGATWCGQSRATTTSAIRNQYIAESKPCRAPSLAPEVKYDGYKWGMAIDINACNGCNACVVGCQAENNIPVVGKDQVLRGREMHWLRVDTYHRGASDNPETYFQPVPCMHCENAPCEVVCPVGATVHSAEGLNDMVYNRCVGTVLLEQLSGTRRLSNLLLYQDWDTPSLKLARNPDVTVRSRGVMEKCTYCVQRINTARIEAEKQDRRIVDGEIKTACEQAPGRRHRIRRPERSQQPCREAARRGT